jgi:ketosteroid isomerase-like protein
VSERQRTVERYIEGFRRGDHDMVLECLTDDVEWNLLGWQSLEGKDQFAAEIRNDAFVGNPDLTIERMVEDEDLVVALGAGRARLRNGGELEFVFSDVFFFEGSKIRRLDTYQVNLSGGPQAVEG